MLHENKYGFEEVLFGLSMISAVFSVLQTFDFETGLSEGQWLLFALVFVCWSIYLCICKTKSKK